MGPPGGGTVPGVVVGVRSLLRSMLTTMIASAATTLMQANS
jgi:hypothetical protein